ncbi:MAG: 3-hydroxybutyrate dehydrogenase [Hyphomicrobiaceae bacterium]
MAVGNLSVDLSDRVALVTGSTGGMGEEVARQLAASGAIVAIHGLGEPELIEQIRVDIEGLSGKPAVHLAHDLTDAPTAAAMVREVESRFGRVDILVNNAGIQHVSPLEDFPDERWDALIAVNLSAAFHATKAAFPGMKQRRFGRVIATSSTLGVTAEMNKAAYVSSKHGIIGLMRSTALEGAEYGITANAIMPGWVLTPLAAGQVERKVQALGLPREAVVRDHFLNLHPTKRFVETREIAGAVLFLCSDAASSITGAAIPVDGGELIL